MIFGDASLFLFSVGMHNRLSTSHALCRTAYSAVPAGWRCGGAGLVIGAVQSLAGQHPAVCSSCWDSFNPLVGRQGDWVASLPLCESAMELAGDLLQIVWVGTVWHVPQLFWTPLQPNIFPRLRVTSQMFTIYEYVVPEPQTLSRFGAVDI